MAARSDVLCSSLQTQEGSTRSPCPTRRRTKARSGAARPAPSSTTPPSTAANSASFSGTSEPSARQSPPRRRWVRQSERLSFLGGWFFFLFLLGMWSDMREAGRDRVYTPNPRIVPHRTRCPSPLQRATVDLTAPSNSITACDSCAWLSGDAAPTDL